MALVKISELPATVTVLDTQEIPTNNAGVNEKVTIGQLRNGSLYSITASYNMSLTDGYTRIHFNHSATTKLIEVNLPNVASSTGRAILFQNIGISGLSYINGNGANIIFGSNTVTTLKMFMLGDFFILRSNGTVWYVEAYNVNIITNFINRNDYTNEEIGSTFNYDNKSAAVDLTGQHFIEATSNQRAVILYDSGGVGLSGTMYVYYITDSGTGLGYWTNNRQCTCGSGGYTFDVNEAGTGNSKNNDSNFCHALGININNFIFQFFWNTTATFTGAQRIVEGLIYIAPTAYGIMPNQVDTNNVLFQTGAGGIDYIDGNGVLQALDIDDVYFNIKLSLKV